MLRFKNNDGSEFPEWEEKKLGDISERILVGLATTVTPYYRKKGRPMFRNLNIKQGYLDDRDMLFLDDDYADSQKNKVIHFGDILTVHTGNIGWSCLVPEKYEGALSFTTLITTVKSNVVSNKYVCAFLNSPLGMNRMQNLAFSGGRANLNTSEFQKVQVPVPCLEEQQKIADCISSLDEVIEKQKATLAAWEERKKGVMQKLFSQEVRFKADDGSDFPDWEEKKLGDICEYRKGQSVGVNYVGTENMNQNFSGVDSLDSTNEVKGATYCVGDTLMSNIRPYLKKTWKADRNGVCSTDVLVFRPVNVDSDFLYYNISSEKFVLYVMTGVKGSKMPRGDKGHIMEYDMLIPCLAEQQKIADCLSSLDEVIEKQKATLAAWEELKKGLLQQMFV